MRILFHALCGVAQPHFSQQGEHLFITLCVGHFLVKFNYFTHLRTDGFHRVEGITRILRDEANPRATKGIETFR